MTDDSAKKSDDQTTTASEEAGEAPAAPKASRPFDVFTISLAAVLGAALALILQFALTMGGVWPGGATTGAGGGSVDLAPLESRLAALEQAGPTGAGTSDADIADLRQSVSRLRDQVTRLESQPRDNGAAPDLSAFTRMVEDLETQLDGIDARTAVVEGRVPADLGVQLAGFADQAALDDVAARLIQLEEDFEMNDTRRAAMGLGLAQLARAAGGSRPFDEELAAVTLLRPDDALVAQLAPFAEDGVPTLAMLQADFPAVARGVARAAQTPEELTAWGRVWAWLGQFISFRRTGETDGESAAAILARAEQRLSEGDLDAALDEMNALPPSAQEAAAEWVARAEARVALDQVITALSAEIIAELSADR